MVILDKINKYYYSGGEKIHVIDNVSAVLPDKGLVFILGPSGSGKSTLLNLLGGLDNPDSGDIWIENRKLSSFSKAEKIAYLNSYLGFVFQEYNILKDLSLKENITLALEIQKHSRKEINKRFKEIISAVELNGLEKRKVSQLSGGQKQRIAIARALIKQPKMIIADEPTGNLDSETSKNIFNLFKELSKERLIVIVSHDVESAQIYADQIIQMGMAEAKDEETEETPLKEETSSSKKKVKEVSPLVLFKQNQRKDLNEVELLRKNALNAKHLTNEDVGIHSLIEERIALQNELVKLQKANTRLKKLSSSTLYFFDKAQDKIKEAKEKELALKIKIELALKNNTDSIEEICKTKRDEILARPKPRVDAVVKKADYVEVLEKFGLDQDQEHNIKLTKAKIPTKIVVKLAIKNLWKKKFRYLVMLLVCAISLAFLSFTIELNGNPLRQNVFTMVENGYQYTEIKRYVPIEDTSTHDFYAKYNYGDLPADSYTIIKEGVPELTLHKYETVEIKYAGSYIENKNYFYTGVINTIIEYDKTNTYRLLCGTTPTEGTQEVMITDYLVSALQYFNLVPKYENYEEYLGMYLDLNWYQNYKVVGIIDSNYEKWSKFYRLGTIDETVKDNYSFINDFKMMNSVVLTKEYFEEETKTKGDYTRLDEQKINFQVKDYSTGDDFKNYNPVAISIMSTTVAQGTSLFTPNDYWSERLPESRMPQNELEIVLPIQVVEKMYNFSYSSSNWGSRRELYTIWKENFINKEITLNITSNDGTTSYEKNFKVVGLTTSTANYIIHDKDLSEIKDIFLSRNENIMVELPSDPEKALDLFNKAYKLRDEEKGIPGYIINVWVYRSDIDSYEVDPFIEIISKGGLFVFTVFTIGIMWTIISIEIVDSRKEIGILRSIGLSGVKVSLIFILQTVTVNLLAYGLAVFLSSKFIPFYNSSITDVTGKIILYLYTLTYRTPVYLLIFVLVMTITCTILPLIKIMSQKIIDVINEREK